MLQALAFVPQDDVHSVLNELLDSPFFKTHQDILDSYLEYFTRTWIGSFSFRGARSAPLFPIPLWNCRDSVLNDLPKTNNFSEGFNMQFLSMLSAHHPTLSKFVENLIKINKLTNCKVEQFYCSQLRSPKLTDTRKKDRLKKAVLKYNSVSNLDFLRIVANCI